LPSETYPPYPSDPADWILFGIGTPEMREVVNERSFIEKILRVEAALATAEGELGVIPKDAAEEIVKKASIDYIDMNKVKERLQKTGGHFIVAIIEPWREGIGDAGEFVHWGATTQDITDTAMVLLIKEANELILRDLLGIRDALIQLARKYRDTPMAARSHVVHALPFTFGLKVSVWLDEISRHIERFRCIEKELLVGNIMGAVGTYASFGEKGPDIQRFALRQLGLECPVVSWNAARDRFANYMNLLAMTATTLSKLAIQILILMRPEIQEIEEPIPPGHVGSSTMPQKRNPFKSEITVALARILRAYAQTITESMETYDERGFNTWFAEFLIIPRSCLIMSTILQFMKEITQTLVVRPENMKRNLELSGGLINSEAIMMALAKKIGRLRAHHIVYDCVEIALKERRPFKEVLLQNDTIAKYLMSHEVDRLLDPMGYVGLSSQIVDETIKRATKND
jgi:adenylosuccinate lyase